MVDLNVGPRFRSKIFRILNYFALSGSSNKGQIQRLIKPSIDKPTIYKAVKLLEDKRWVERRPENLAWVGRAKYYRITSSGFRELLHQNYGLTKSRLSEKTILRMMEKNPHLDENGWINVYHALRPTFIKANKRGTFLGQVGGVLPLIIGEDPRFVLSILVSELLSQAKNEADASASIRKLLRELRPYPSHYYTVRQLLVDRLTEANETLQTARVDLVKIKRVTSDLAKSSEKTSFVL
jgi:DNA-binding PadR family transcriptional regulator